jgi:hypothetical protein
LIIELQRAHTPEDHGHEEACGICGEPFLVESVRIDGVTDDHSYMGLGCPDCLAVLGTHRPGRFPTIEEYGSPS